MSLSTSNSENTTRRFAAESDAADDRAPAQEESAPSAADGFVARDQKVAAEMSELPIRRRFRRVVLRDAAIVIVTLLVAELLLRIIAPEYGHNLYDRTHTGGAAVEFNRDGCRGAEIPVAKAPDELRLLCLGDSMTFGTGIAAQDTWPAQLKDQLLAGSSNRPVSVINAGLQGVSLADLATAYDQKWSQWHPDVVCLLASGNMISLASIERTDPKMGPVGHMPNYGASETAPTKWGRFQESAAAAVSTLCLPTWLSINSQRALYFMGVLDNSIDNPREPFGAMLAHGWVQGGLPPQTARDSWNWFGTDLVYLQRIAARHGAVLLVAMAPSRFELSDSWSDNQKQVPKNRLTIDPTATMKSIAGTIGVPCIDLLAALKSGRQRLALQQGKTPDLYILFDYTHLDRDGNGIVARAMATRIDGRPRD